MNKRELELKWHIWTDPDRDGKKHTVILFEGGAFACSCGETSENHNGFFYRTIPSLIVHGCVICGNVAMYVKSLEDYLCEEHKADYIDWNSGNPESPRIDFLREFLPERFMS